jgi:putative transferase (TIGR04331 family)
MTKQLWLKDIPDDYNREKDILLGPWCVLGKEDQYTEMDKLIFESDAFNSFEEVSIAEEIIAQFSKYYIHKLSNKLNQIHNVNYSVEYWKIILFPWLLTISQVTWERQLIINKVLYKYRNEIIKINLASDTLDIDIHDTQDFTNMCQNMEFNYWLFSRLIEKKIPDNWRVSFTKINPVRSEYEPPKGTYKTKVHRFITKLFPSESIFGVSVINSLILEFILSIKSLSFNGNVSNSEPNIKDEIDISWNLDWDSLIMKTLPKCFTENCPEDQDYFKWTRKLYLINGTKLYYDEHTKKKIAYAINNGSKIITTQHGGGYGTGGSHSWAPDIEYSHYKYFSWGWDKQADYPGDIVPMPSPILSKYSYKRENNNIIFINTAMRLFTLRYGMGPTPSQWIMERESIKFFIRDLTEDVRKNLWYRPWFNTIGVLLDADYITHHFPKIKILYGDLHKETMKCKLLILIESGTTLCIAMAANIPVICLWNPKTMGLCHQALPYFDELKRVGIIHDTAQSAALKVNEISDNIDNWWQQPSVQKARKQFAWRYARTSKQWKKEWIKAIWDLKAKT